MNLILVDDEVLMVEALKKIIGVGRPGIDIAGEAHDGCAALEMLERLRPDIAIIDIRMPGMDGLQLMQEIKEQNLKTKVLILSAYRDFDYAQKAIRFGASGYLVKPVDRVKLLEELDRSMQTIRDENDASAMAGIAAGSLPLLRANYLRQTLNRTARLDEAGNQGRALVDVEERDCQLMLVSLDSPIPLAADMEQQAVEGAEAALKEKTKGAAFFTAENELAAVFNHRDGLDSAALAGAVRQAIHKLLPLNMDIGISGKGFESAVMADAYREAAEALAFKFYLGPNAVIPHSRIGEICFQANPVLIENEDYLIEQIKLGNGEEAQRILIAIRDRLENDKNVYPDAVYQTFSNLLLYLRKALKDFFSDAELQALLPQTDREDLKRFRTFGRLFDNILLQVRSITTFIESKRRSDDSRLIEKAKRYCDENYAGDITLEAISEHVSMAKNYFCTHFKKKTGENFWDYLTDLRIGKAKELLEKTELKIGAVAERVGYKNSSHFCRVFKEAVGVSPAEYKIKRLGKKSGMH